MGRAANGEELLKKTEDAEADIIISDVVYAKERQVWMFSAGSGANGWKIKVLFLSG